MGVPAVANVVTGFLGSGKTTLIRAALGRGLADRRVALIVNEVADVGIDGVALEGVNVDRMLELPGGCICCTAGSRFVLAVQEIVDRVQPHLIVIETSGAAEPGPVVSELSLAGVRTDAVVTVVDAEQVIRFCREHETAARQVEAADFLVVNKTDLVWPADLARVETFLRRLNPRALQLPTTYGAAAPDLLFATGAARYWRREPDAGRAGATAHLERDGLTAVVFRADGAMNRRRFERFLDRLPPRVYRAKGVLTFAGERRPSLFNYTCGRWQVDWLPVDGPSRNRAVLIGKELAADGERLLRALARCLEGA